MSTTSESPIAFQAPRSSKLVPDMAMVEDRRLSSREPQDATGRLIGWDGAEAVPCRICNVAEGGVFVHVADAADLRVGGRYELIVEESPASSDLAGAVGSCCYATVVRTSHVTDAGDAAFGAGLRFDQPLML